MINKRYIIGKKIGEGRSKVFNVIDTEFPEREVAAKFLSVSVSQDEKEKFREEYFTLKNLDHPNIIKAFELNSVIHRDDEEDSEIDQFSPFITMEYFPSQELLNYFGLNEERVLLSIIKQICSVLYYLHQSNYIYYDLKAENILISENNNQPVIKLIDLGFAYYTNEEVSANIIGSPLYLAPELLKNEKHDHRVDLYSLGILLYRIVYGRFPFVGSTEIEIFKAHVEDEVVLGESKFSPLIINVIEKLLKKDPVERYQNALQILAELNIPIDIDITKDFVPAKVFSDRKDALNILNTYLNDKNSNEVFTINGFDSSGKSSLLKKINQLNIHSVFVENPKTKSSIDSLKYILKKLVFTETVFQEKEKDFNSIAEELCDEKSDTTIELVKKIFNTVNNGFKYIVLLDDFNLYDEFIKETLIQLIQIFQVKGIKVILAETLDLDQASNALHNICPIQINQFTEHQLSEFIDLSYSNNFPKDEIKKIILLYSDLLPGSIKQFIKDVILLKVLQYDGGNITFDTNEQTALTLQSSHEELYRIRLSNLSSIELKLAQIISAFDISIEQTVLSALLDISIEKLRISLSELEKKNIIESLNISNAPKINSFNFKNYIYSTINNRTKFHLIHANAIKKLFPDFNTVELARQYEAANEFEKSVEVLQKEIEKAESLHYYSYKRLLLENSIKFSLPEKKITSLIIELVRTLYKLSDYKNTLENVYKLNIDKLSQSEKDEILFIKGSSLIETGNTDEGKKVLVDLIEKTTDENLKEKANIEVAYAEFDLGNFQVAESISNTFLKRENLDYELQGKLLSLLSLIEYQTYENVDKALELSENALNKFERKNILHKEAGTLVNIGALYSTIGKDQLAKECWKKALEINASIGNLEQEGIIYLNYGVFYHSKLLYEDAIQVWQKAKNIFSAIDLRNSLGLAIGNIGEVNSQCCDYQNGYNNLLQAIEIYGELNNKEQELYFLYTLGKLFLELGDKDELLKVCEKYELCLTSIALPKDNEENNYNCLKLLKHIIADTDEEIEINSIYLKIKDYCIQDSHLDILFIYINYLIRCHKHKTAIDLLNLSPIKEIISQNVILTAHQYYLFGKIAQQDASLLELPAIEYFEKAYSLLEGESIFELTWKVLYEIASTYFERGNFYKARQPRIYAYELINLIGNNITNDKIRNTYFNHPERKQALEKLVYMGSQTQFNEYQKS